MRFSRRTRFLTAILLACNTSGCSPSSTEKASSAPSRTDSQTAAALADSGDAASDSLPPIPGDPWQQDNLPLSGPEANDRSESDLGIPMPAQRDTDSPATIGLEAAPIQQPFDQSNEIPVPAPTVDASKENFGVDPIDANDQGGPRLALIDPDENSPNSGLKPDLSPDELLKFLSMADKDMQLIVSGQAGFETPEESRKALLQIVRMKQEASKRLADDETLPEKTRVEGKRGQLQALSHLASLGDLASAKLLEKQATDNLSSTSPELVSDSRLVLIGFAIEDLQNGVKSAPQQIVGLVDQLAGDISQSDVPAMMVMGQARGLLASYGHDIEAKAVRDTIIDVFANSPDPRVAEMAAAMAGNVRFDAIDQLVNRVTSGEDVPVPQWTEAAQTLIDESADLQTVQYLSGAAVEFESRDKMDLASATYEAMEKRFTDPDSASYREMQMAIEARNARQSAIGRQFDFSLPAVDYEPLSMVDYRGKIVLMPFWSIDFPQSLQVVPQLNQWAKKHPDQIAIVGMNLDPDFERVEQFARMSKMKFRSFRAESSAETTGANPAAAQFGVVSLPCVAIFDGEGRAVKVDFAGRQLDRVVQELLENK